MDSISSISSISDRRMGIDDLRILAEKMTALVTLPEFEAYRDEIKQTIETWKEGMTKEGQTPENLVTVNHFINAARALYNIPEMVINAWEAHKQAEEQAREERIIREREDRRRPPMGL